MMIRGRKISSRVGHCAGSPEAIALTSFSSTLQAAAFPTSQQNSLVSTILPGGG